MQAKIFFLLLVPFLSFGQKPVTDFNYALADTATIGAGETPKVNRELQATFYADSIPLREWFKDTKDTIETSLRFETGIDSLFRTIIVRYPWTKDFLVSDYRVLSIYNASNYPKKLYSYNELIKADAASTQYALEKVSCFLQAKDENGNWKDVDLTQDSINKVGTYKTFIRSHEIIYVIVKPPAGDYETQLRFKLLTNSPPDYPREQYIYSDIFNGTIDKLLLSNK